MTDSEPSPEETHHLFLYDSDKGWITLVFHEDGTVTWKWTVLGGNKMREA